MADEPIVIVPCPVASEHGGGGYPMSTDPTAAAWRCDRCGDPRWIGWRNGPAHEGWPRKAQCVPCGHVQDLPEEEAPRV